MDDCQAKWIVCLSAKQIAILSAYFSKLAIPNTTTTTPIIVQKIGEEVERGQNFVVNFCTRQLYQRRSSRRRRLAFLPATGITHSSSLSSAYPVFYFIWYDIMISVQVKNIRQHKQSKLAKFTWLTLTSSSWWHTHIHNITHIITYFVLIILIKLYFLALSSFSSSLNYARNFFHLFSLSSNIIMNWLSNSSYLSCVWNEPVFIAILQHYHPNHLQNRE